MEKNMYEDYLEHHGIKGMKWGVRRYQNYDGTLTPAGEKRLHKLNSVRDRKAQRAMDKSRGYKQEANKLKYDLEDLNKFGTSSNAWQMHKRDVRDAKRFKYEINNPGMTYNSSWDSIFDSIDSWANEKHYFNEYVKDITNDHKNAVENAKTWAKRNKDLMNMPITVDTTRRDIRRTYNGKWTKYSK